ncbi:MAG: class IV adenylate cyclase [Candidatus Aenigmarchaeota archaeon]|nr:class IV adenylate cyclase [Candidatus Aenigmarchaeota archaeon]
MQEIEVKILEIDKERIDDKLRTLGARKTFDGIVTAVYYDFPDGYLEKQDKTLRLRKKESVIETQTEFTSKTPVSRKKAKIMTEHEVCVDDYDKMKKLLESIGFIEYKTLIKQRISYSIGKVHFEIDTLPNIPTFLEIEAPDIKTLEKQVTLLGYKMKDAKPWSGKDVMKYYGKK